MSNRYLVVKTTKQTDHRRKVQRGEPDSSSSLSIGSSEMSVEVARAGVTPRTSAPYMGRSVDSLEVTKTDPGSSSNMMDSGSRATPDVRRNVGRSTERSVAVKTEHR